MALRKEKSEGTALVESKEYNGVSGQQKIIYSGAFSMKNDIETLNGYLANGWTLKRQRIAPDSSSYFLIEKD